jgi:transposase-like protein
MPFREVDYPWYTHNESECICPYCGYIQEDMWDYGFNNEEYDLDFVCQHCEKTFKLEIYTQWLYTTDKIEEENE